MLDWFYSIDHDKFDPYVKGMATSDWLHMHTSMGKRHMTWEQVCSSLKIYSTRDNPGLLRQSSFYGKLHIVEQC